MATVSGNNVGFTNKRALKGAETARLIGDNEMPGVTFEPEHFPDAEAVPPSVETLNTLAEPQFADADVYEEPPNPEAAPTAADQHAHVPEMDDAAFPLAQTSLPNFQEWLRTFFTLPSQSRQFSTPLPHHPSLTRRQWHQRLWRTKR